jgi:hypothetical protein
MLASYGFGKYSQVFWGRNICNTFDDYGYADDVATPNEVEEAGKKRGFCCPRLVEPDYGNVRA